MNDNHFATHEECEAVACGHGQAALLLVESLIHGLCEASVLTAQDALAVAERALDVQRTKMAAQEDPAAAAALYAHRLLGSIVTSLHTDVRGRS